MKFWGTGFPVAGETEGTFGILGRCSTFETTSSLRYPNARMERRKTVKGVTGKSGTTFDKYPHVTKAGDLPLSFATPFGLLQLSHRRPSFLMTVNNGSVLEMGLKRSRGENRRGIVEIAELPSGA